MVLPDGSESLDRGNLMGRTVKMQLRGAASDGEHVRLGEFLVQLRALQLALIRTEQMISDEERPSTYYRITDLSHSSPATVVLEAAPYRRERPVDVGEQVIKKFFVGLKQISETGLVSEDYDRATLETYQKLSQTLQRNITEIKLSTPGYQISITPEFAARIEHLLGSDVVREGAIDGMLEAIYLHNKVNKFYIFPSVGPAKVTCHFPEEMMRDKRGSAVNGLSGYSSMELADALDRRILRKRRRLLLLSNSIVSITPCNFPHLSYKNNKASISAH